MFDAIWDMKIGYVLCGIIIAVTFGFAVGNYACSLVHRLPRGKLLLDKTPYCGACGTLLQTADLFPVFSALLLRHRCRYCGQPFPVSHTWTELLVGLLFVLTFFQHGYGEAFVLIAFIGVFLITLAAIEVNDRLVMGRVLLCLAVSGMLYRTLADLSIFNFVQASLLGVLVSAFLWRKEIRKVGHVYVLPPYAYMVTVGALCVGMQHLLLYGVLMLVFTAIFFIIAALRRKPLALSIPFSLAVILPVFYPHMSLMALIK